MGIATRYADTHPKQGRSIANGDVVVGLYDFASSQAALRWAAQQAKATKAPLRAVHVLEWPIGPTASADTGPATELYLPEEEVDIAYRRGMSRGFNDINPQPDWTLQFAKGVAAEVLIRQLGEMDEPDRVLVGIETDPGPCGYRR